jgi:outer membrane protein TolC
MLPLAPSSSDWEPDARGLGRSLGRFGWVFGWIFTVCFCALGQVTNDVGVPWSSGPTHVRSPAVPLSLADALNLALRQSASIQLAQKAVEAEQGVAIQTRAVAMPKIAVTGNYTAVEPSAVDTPPALIPEFTFGTDQSWQAQVKLVQSVYEGGRIVSALRSAKLIQKASVLDYQAEVANLVLEVQRTYYAVLLAREQVSVQTASVELLTRELADTTRRFEAGVVPRFNVLRAEVELANARPRLSQALNALRISGSTLATLLALDMLDDNGDDVALHLADSLNGERQSFALRDAIGTALKLRPELRALALRRQLLSEDVKSARAGYKPSLQAFGGYESRNSMFSPDLDREVHGWMAGVQLRWDLFDGRLTEGRVRQARAQMEAADIRVEDARRNIDLEVRASHSTFMEAGEVLDSQEKALEQAAEALRLAQARSEAGTGTQLDVLSAQTALTEARSTRVRALHDLAVAKARLERAMGINIPENSLTPRPAD